MPLPSYPPVPWHLTGFDAMLAYASLEDPDHDRARKVVRATAGLVRIDGQDLVTREELRWTMHEAKQEPAGPPDYRFLLATLGLPSAMGWR